MSEENREYGAREFDEVERFQTTSSRQPKSSERGIDCPIQPVNKYLHAVDGRDEKVKFDTTHPRSHEVFYFKDLGNSQVAIQTANKKHYLQGSSSSINARVIENCDNVAGTLGTGNF